MDNNNFKMTIVLREVIKEQTAKYFNLPKGAEVSKELMAKYMLNIDSIDFAYQTLSTNICNKCMFNSPNCPSNIAHIRTGVGEYENNVYECGGFKLCQ